MWCGCACGLWIVLHCITVFAASPPHTDNGRTRDVQAPYRPYAQPCIPFLNYIVTFFIETKEGVRILDVGAAVS